MAQPPRGPPAPPGERCLDAHENESDTLSMIVVRDLCHVSPLSLQDTATQVSKCFSRVRDRGVPLSLTSLYCTRRTRPLPLFSHFVCRDGAPPVRRPASWLWTPTSWVPAVGLVCGFFRTLPACSRSAILFPVGRRLRAPCRWTAARIPPSVRTCTTSGLWASTARLWASAAGLCPTRYALFRFMRLEGASRTPVFTPHSRL
jgi:hypothetical protein